MHLPANLTAAAAVPANGVQSPHWERRFFVPLGPWHQGRGGGPLGWLEMFPDPLHLVFLAPSLTCEWNLEIANPSFLLGKILFS